MSQHPDRVTPPSRTIAAPAQDDHRVAEVAARRAGVTVEEVREPGRLKEVEQLFQVVWNTRHERPPISADVLRALVHSGSYVGVAIGSDGRIAGAGVGFLATDLRSSGSAVDSLHSHIAAVAPGTERHGIGSALKLHQRAWAIDNGLRSITWTFDPLVRRNAGFNSHLGARFVRYYPEFYGEMADGRNAGHGSDRLLARWDLDLPATPLTADEQPAGGSALLDLDAAGRPVPGVADGDRSWVATPADIERIRSTDPELARAWRVALRAALHPMLPQWRIDGFTPAGRYLLVREPDIH